VGFLSLNKVMLSSHKKSRLHQHQADKDGFLSISSTPAAHIKASLRKIFAIHYESDFIT
jgi:hypothetical protein